MAAVQFNPREYSISKNSPWSSASQSSTIIRPRIGWEVQVAVNEAGLRLAAARKASGFSPQFGSSDAGLIVRSIAARFPDSQVLFAVQPAVQPGWRLVSSAPGVVAVLIGLLLPAVQKVREAAARAQSMPALYQALVYNESFQEMDKHRHPDLYLNIWINQAASRANGRSAKNNNWIEICSAQL